MERVKINKKKNEVVLSFNEKFYDKKFINQAVEDFKESCDIKKDKDFIFLKPKKGIELDTLGYEFYNYVLGLIKNN